MSLVCINKVEYFGNICIDVLMYIVLCLILINVVSFATFYMWMI